jgi:PncC family amidohydrolase
MGTHRLVKRLGELLLKKKLTIATAESCTGGLIGAAITAVSGSSDYFDGGVIAYDNRIKRDLLGVPARVLGKYGAVSAETVLAMASGACRLLKTDCAIAVSGIAGPGGGTTEKPVGLVYIGIAVRDSCRAVRCNFSGERQRIREKTVERSLREMIAAVGKA